MLLSTPKRHASRAVRLWLLLLAGLVALMILVGGATRLTDSGLSIVEWRPVTGAIPPLTEADWLAEFEKYKAIPEYERVNWGMSLSAFKEIYWWEWGHRFLGRLIGLVFALPFAWFLMARRINRKLGLRLAAILALGALQGAVGWWMVASGLTERIDVSQYRLAAHLGLALILFGAILWLVFDLGERQHGSTANGNFRLIAAALAVGVYLQMILGAFVAGLRAGRSYNTWPLMDGRFFPEGYFADGPRFADLFETAAAVQFNHRLGAYLLLAAATVFAILARRCQLGGLAAGLLAALVAQASLGIWTVLAATPISLGLAHQGGALVAFAIALRLTHKAFVTEKPVL